MDQDKRACQDIGTDPVATARNWAPNVTVPIADRSGRMISPHEVTGVTVTGTNDLDGISPRKLAAVFRQTLQPYNGASTRWICGVATQTDLAFLQWITNHRTMGYVHVVTPYMFADLSQEVRTAIDLASRLHDDFSVTELDMEKAWPEPDFAAAREMVNHSHIVVGFPHESKQSSIANFTLTYAGSLGLPYMKWPVGE